MSFSSSKVDNLAKQLMRHKRLYYSGSPEISDEEFDKLENLLRSLDKDHPALSFVGSETSLNLKKIPHKTPMLSLQKSYKMEDLIKWAGSNEVVGTIKIDGNSLSLVYENGQLVTAKTRGNGKIGEDVLDKIIWVPSIPKKISSKEKTLEIRGELFCYQSQFENLIEEMIDRNLEKPSSSRNIVAGVLGRKSHLDLASWFNFFAFDALCDENEDYFSSEQSKFEWLSQNGFQTPEYGLISDEKNIELFLEKVRTEMNRGEIAIDGAVFSFNDLALQKEMGNTSHHPRYKMSFKWQGDTAFSPIEKIIWNTSKYGIVTPVAVITPVELSGANITNVTLHNALHVKTHNLCAGDVIEIVRSGEVIPKFLSVYESSEGDYELPEACPSCETKLLFDDVRLKCPNSLNCSAQTSGSILNWIKAVGIDDLSEKRLFHMIDMELVSEVPDLYKLTTQDLLTLPLTKEKMANKIIRNIENSKKLPLATFLNGLGIAGMGLTTWEKLISHHPNLEKIRALDEATIIQIDGFAEKSAKDLVDGLHLKSDLIDRLLDCEIEPIEPDEKPITGNQIFSNMSFAITGKLSKPRAEIESYIKSNGGGIVSSVSKNTSVLIINDLQSTSSKAVKAKELGIELWDEQALFSKT